MADQITLPPVRFLDPVTGDISRTWRDYLEALSPATAGANQWTLIDFTGSDIADILTRPHSGLQSILGADETDADSTKDKHVSNLQLKTAYDDIADNLAAIKSMRVLHWIGG